MRLLIFALVILSLGSFPLRADEPTPEAARAALHRAVKFFRTEVSAGPGGYLWRYSADLSMREGEGEGKPTTAWLQPPGTPSVGEAYLAAYRLTGDELLLEAAVETAQALVRGQLVSGGWADRMEFAPEDRKRYAYRVDEPRGKANRTTFDDDKSQSAIRFLMRVDQTLGFKNETIHEACEWALNAFLKAQYPNGAWPQQYEDFPDPKEFPVRRASYPADWPRIYSRTNYAGFYTLNDNTIADVIDVMLLAAEIYDDPRYQAAAKRGGEFFLLAQMPEPQPGWAQQYTREMHPAWARKFEPPALTGSESQGVMQTLLTLARETGDAKFLQPLPKALAYYKKSQLKDGRLARFYELKTNRPLYFTKEYQLTYEPDDLPTHYAFIVSSKLDRIERDHQRLLDTDPAKWKPERRERTPQMSTGLRNRAAEVISQLDDRGAWVEPGKLRREDARHVTKIIDSRTFSENVVTLAQFLAASK